MNRHRSLLLTIAALGLSILPAVSAADNSDPRSDALRETAAKSGKKCVVTVREGSGVRLLDGTFEKSEHTWLFLDQRGKKLLVSLDTIIAISFEN